jgi:hypothetical protein
MPVNETTERIIFEGVDRLSAASKSAQASTKALKDTIDGVKEVMGALGVTVGAGAFINLQLQVLHATAALDDMAEATGASVEKLSAIQNVAKVGGQDFEGLTGQLGRMTKNLKENKEEGTKAAFALNTLGLKAKDQNGHWRDTGDVLIDVANKLAKYQDGAGKVALIQDILGKGAERYLPLLKDIAEKTDLHSKVTKEQAAQAEAAEKNINRLKVAMEDARKETVNQFTPAIITFTEKLLAANTAMGGFWQGLNQIMTVSGDQAADPMGSLVAVEERLKKLNELKQTLGGNSVGAIANRFLAPEDLATVNKQIAYATAQQRILQELAKRQMDRGGKDPNSPLFEFEGGGVKPLDYESPDLAKAQRLRQLIAKNTLEDEERLAQDRVAIEKVITDNLLEQIERRKAADKNALESHVILYEEEVNRLEQIDLDAFERRKTLRGQRYGRDADERDANDAFEGKKAQLNIFTNEELEIYGGRNQLIEDMEREHADRIIRIRLEALQRGRDMYVTGYRGQAQAIFGELQNMTAGVAQHSKLLFEINKVATIATLALKTPEAIGSAYAFGAKFGGPPLGAAMAIVAGLAMAAQMKAALATQYTGGGGGTAPSVAGTTPAPAVSPVAPTTAADSASQRTVLLKIVGEGQRFTIDQVRELAEAIADLSEGGVVIS